MLKPGSMTLVFQFLGQDGLGCSKLNIYIFLKHNVAEAERHTTKQSSIKHSVD